MPDLDRLYSKNARNMRKSVIRELLKLTQRPDIISFAGGLPAPETFPVEALREAADQVFERHAAAALQYGTTEGDEELKRQLLALEAEDGVRVGTENILVVSGSQQALDIIPKLFLDPGDLVVAGHPTYLGAIQAIQSYQGRILGIPFAKNKDGFDLDELERRFSASLDGGRKPKYLYVIPDFHNPTGITWSLEKRRALLSFAYRRDLLVVEDSPYRQIRFLGESLPTLYQLDQEGEGRGNVVGLKTFSKTLAPGPRIGWITARADLVARMVIAKQAMDLCSNVFAQSWLAAFLASGKLPGVVAATCANYREKRDHMVAMLRRSLPSRPDIDWTEPEGGLFLWLSLPRWVDTDLLLLKAIERRVAYVGGSSFYFENPERNSLRLNFSYASLEGITEGIGRLAAVIVEELEAHEGDERAESLAG